MTEIYKDLAASEKEAAGLIDLAISLKIATGESYKRITEDLIGFGDLYSFSLSGKGRIIYGLCHRFSYDLHVIDLEALLSRDEEKKEIIDELLKKGRLNLDAAKAYLINMEDKEDGCEDQSSERN